MFDRTEIHPTRTEYVGRDINVTVNRAPTDASVKLLTEMERTAVEKLVCSGHIGNTEVDAHWFLFNRVETMEVVIRVRVKLNGKDHVLDIPLKRGVSYTYFLEHIHEELGKAIAKEILLTSVPTRGFSEMIQTAIALTRR